MSRTFKAVRPPERRVGPSFDDYLKTVYGPNAGQIPPMQRGEIEQAYYAGIHWLLGVLATQLEPGAEPTDTDVAMLEGIHREVQAYSAVRHASLTFNFERGAKS